MIYPLDASFNKEVQSTLTDFPLWYNRHAEHIVVPDVLKPFIEGVHYVSTKQVPSALLLRHSGSTSVKPNAEVMLRAGFTLTQSEMEGPKAISHRDLFFKRTVGHLPSSNNSLARLLRESEEVQEEVNDDDLDVLSHSSSGEEDSDAPDNLEKVDGRSILKRKKLSIRVKYEDPWKIHAASHICEVMGKTHNVVQWSGDGIRLQDPLPTRVLGPKWGSSSKNRIRFQMIASDDVKLHVIYEHTHWGKALKRMVSNPESKMRGWANRLKTRINRFLKGASDPLLNMEDKRKLLVHPDIPRDKKVRAERLIELLKTVDGIFIQRYLAYPEEVWTWERFDVFTLGNISYLIGDEFLDGELTPEGLLVDTSYAQLKRCRKWFKQYSHENKLENALATFKNEHHQWLWQFLKVYTRSKLSKGHQRAMLIGLLSQTRGAGTPPSIVVLQSKMKFLTTISTESPKENPNAGILRRQALRKIIMDLPDSAFTGLLTKARITVTASACWEEIRREGGTTEEIRRILNLYGADNQIPVRDLDTGKVVRYTDAGVGDTTGELIFWACLDQTLMTPKDVLKNAFLTLVKEPGKARSVTKALACLKIVLDLVNKICSEPLKKGIRSSKSGMAASNHGWNFFNRLYEADLKDLVFNPEVREESEYAGYVERIDIYGDLFVLSTDYEEATDQMHHNVAAEIGMTWMRKCGIPAILRGIVAETCFKPRNVFFYSSGVLDTVGEPAPQMGDNIRSVKLVKGILMGDPLTKPILHIANVIARSVGAGLFDQSLYRGIHNSKEVHESFFAGLGNIPSPTISDASTFS
uniref:RNA-dependent RNA polymerase n=1 Tax=Downy mildew lesion associated splipalmivirus 19 TaxID=2719502 RepID=A0A6G9RVB1_9VIRU|nr:RNA-dependent RNA polymerase [Plasmopara viticola lesion associated narnavirus 19]